jgi:hypothetical protein
MTRTNFPEIVRERVNSLAPTSAFLEQDEPDAVWNRRRFGSRINITRQVIPGSDVEIISAFVSGGKKREVVISELIEALGQPKTNIPKFAGMPNTSSLQWPVSRLTQINPE